MNSWLLGFFIAFFYVFPTNNFYFVVNLLFLLYCIINRKNDVINKAVLPFLIIAIISFVYNITELQYSSMFKEVFRLFNLSIFLLLVPIDFKKVNYHVIGLFLLFSLVLVLLSQLAFLMNIQILVDYIDLYYPYEGEAYGLSTEYILKHNSGSIYDVTIRYSGLFRNPNQCARYVLLLASSLLYFSNRLLKFFVIGISFVSILLTGSRTGVLVLLAIVLVYMIFVERKSQKSLWVIFVLLLVYFFNSQTDLSQYRAFSIEEAVDTSFTTKIEWFRDYIMQENNFLFLLIGHGTSVNVLDYNIPLLDTEWGMVFFSYGVLGFILYFCVLWIYIKNAPKKAKMIFANLIWIISSTVFMSYRMSILFSIMVSLVWYRFINDEEKRFVAKKSRKR